MEHESSLSNQSEFVLSDEQLTFYLKEARTMCPTATENLSDRACLSILCGRIRRITRLLSLIQEDRRSDDIGDIQKACGYYLVDEKTPRNERLKLNRTLSRHISFCNHLTREKDIAGYTLDYFARQLNDLEQYLRQKPE